MMLFQFTVRLRKRIGRGSGSISSSGCVLKILFRRSTNKNNVQIISCTNIFCPYFPLFEIHLSVFVLIKFTPQTCICSKCVLEHKWVSKKKTENTYGPWAWQNYFARKMSWTHLLEFVCLYCLYIWMVVCCKFESDEVRMDDEREHTVHLFEMFSHQINRSNNTVLLKLCNCDTSRSADIDFLKQ